MEGVNRWRDPAGLLQEHVTSGALLALWLAEMAGGQERGGGLGGLLDGGSRWVDRHQRGLTYGGWGWQCGGWGQTDGYWV